MPPKKPETANVDPREVQRGAAVWTKEGYEEIVRSVSIVLHLANGADVVYSENDEVEVLAEQPVTKMTVTPSGEGE